MFSRRMLRIKAMQYLYAHYLHKKIDSTALKSDTKKAVELFQDEVKTVQRNIYSILNLLVEWEKIAIVDDQETSSILKSRLPNNPYINQIKASSFYQEYSQKYPAIWELQLADLMYYKAIKPKKMFLKKKLTPEEESSKSLVEDLVKKVFFKEDSIQREMAIRDRKWAENKAVTRSFFLLFLEKWEKDGSKAFSLLTAQPSDEERKLFEALIEKTKEEHAKHIKWIELHVHNWDIDRIHPLDQLLIEMAMVEIIHLPKVDTNISINEYLEMAKKYSTPKSYIFIHGLLDTFIKEHVTNLPVTE